MTEKEKKAIEMYKKGVEVKGYYDSREKAEEIAEELNSMNDDVI